MTISEEMQKEAHAFDERVAERIRNGQVPDLRRVQPCNWFYNNTWRRPYLVDLDAGREFRFALEHARRSRLLDVGCGMGHTSLEFARNGFEVTALDISAGSLEVAKRVLAENPFHEHFGSLRYLQDDFAEWEGTGPFDTVCFFGNLHHMAELDRVLDKAERLLVPGGRVLVCEPAYDWMSERNGAVVALIRLLLSVQGKWHDPQPLPATTEELRAYIGDCLAELQEGKDKGEEDQSPHDRACGAKEILAGLRARFQEIACVPTDGFFQRVAGGVRGKSEEETRRLAEFLVLFDHMAVTMGLIQPGKLFWAGQKA